MRASIALRSEATELVRLQAFAEAFARDCGFADDERARLLVILEELFTNVVAHGYGAASVAVALGWRRGWLTIDFVDDGLPPDEQWPRQVPPTRKGIVREFGTMPITAQPGARFQYCSRCVVLAAYALEQTVGQSWEAYTRTHIFVPLGMATASFGPLGLEQAPDQAQPYRHDAVSGEVPIPWSRLQYLQALAPAGGIDASVAEIADYALLQLDDGMLAGRRVVSAQMMAELHHPEIAVGANWTAAARIQNLHYALGWFTADVSGVHLVYHNGANPGFRAAIVLAPSAKAGVASCQTGSRSALPKRPLGAFLSSFFGNNPAEARDLADRSATFPRFGAKSASGHGPAC